MYEFRGGFIAHTEPYYQLASFTGGINSLSPSVSSESDPESFSMLPVLPLSRQELTYSNSGSEESDSSSEDDEEELKSAHQAFRSVQKKVMRERVVNEHGAPSHGIRGGDPGRGDPGT